MSQQVTSPLASNSPSIPDYECLRPIGRGAYGEVWLARNVTGSFVALKIVHRAAFDHDRPFEREFEGIQRFEPVSRSDPSQVAILHVGRGDGFFYYVMELADDGSESRLQPVTSENASEHAAAPNRLKAGLQTYVPRTLKQDLRMLGALPSTECVQIALSLTRALAHLHGHGLVHRDVKPSNVIFVNGVAKLADIGLVTSVDATRSFVGTEGYLPPEGAGTPQADLYSLGKVLYEMSTGCERKEFPMLPPDIATRPDRETFAEFNAIVVRACKLDPRERYIDAEAMQSELELLRLGKSVKHQRATSQRLIAFKKVGFLAGALAITALVMQQGFLHLRTKPPQSSPANLSQNAEARRLYSVARWQFNRRPGEGSQEALNAIDRAIELDPKFIQAYVLRFEIYVWTFGVSPHELSVKTGEIAGKLLAIDNSLAEAHAALGWSNHCEFHWEESKRELQLAITLNTNYAMAHALYAIVLTKQGRFEEARPEYQKALDLDPTSRMLIVIAGFPDLYSRHYSNAIVQFQKALEFEPNCKYAYDFIGSAYEMARDYPAAIMAFQKLHLLAGEDFAEVGPKYERRRKAYAETGETGYWQDVFQTEIANNPHTDLQHSAQVYARLGDKTKALDCLEKAFDNRTYTALWLKVSPDWDPLRDEPRFKVMLGRARFTE